jgi:predicted amidohydrolase
MTKVASVQPWFSDDKSKEERIKHAEQMIDRAAGADLILLPELWNTGWYSFDLWRDNSEPLHGETVTRMAEKAKKVNAYILTGSFVEKLDNSLYNTMVLLDPKGKIIATYKKMHLSNLRGVEEAALMKRGEEVVAVKTEIGVLGFGICYDLRFPELFRKMAVLKEVEVFLVAAAWPLVRVESWVEMGHVRAAENQCYLISCNCAGINRGHQFLGHSAIVDPQGTAIANGGLDECIVKGEIDVGELRKFRKDIPTLQNRVLSV